MSKVTDVEVSAFSECFLFLLFFFSATHQQNWTMDWNLAPANLTQVVKVDLGLSPSSMAMGSTLEACRDKCDSIESCTAVAVSMIAYMNVSFFFK